jgi:hypothetical protein
MFIPLSQITNKINSFAYQKSLRINVKQEEYTGQSDAGILCDGTNRRAGLGKIREAFAGKFG